MSSERGTRTILAVAGGGLLVVLLVVLLGGLLVGGVGLRGVERDSSESTASTTPPRPADSTTTTTGITATTAYTTTTTADRGALEGLDVHMDAGPIDAFDFDQPLLDRLPARSVLRINATGFETNGTGFVEQCTLTRCANGFPVVFDINGAANFQYLVSDTFAAGLAPSTCRAVEPPCVVHVRGNGRSAFLTTVFRDVAVPRRVTVAPSALGLVDGSRVRVDVTGFNPGERVQAMLCAAPETRGAERCGAPGPVSSFTIDAGGSGSTDLEIRAGRVGSSGVACGRGATCGIVVSQAGSSVPAPVVEISFATGPGASYDATRTLVGLVAALALVALAVFWVRGTDWRKPSEADTPELDRIELTGDEI